MYYLYPTAARRALIDQLSTYHYVVDPDLLNQDVGYSLASHYYSTFYGLVEQAPLIALRYIRTPGLDLFGVGKSSLLHYCIDGVRACDSDEVSKEAWFWVFTIIPELEPRTLYITNGIGDVPQRTLQIKVHCYPDNIYFRQMKALLD